MPCRDCLYYEKLPQDPSGDTGLCHRYPPTPSFVPGEPKGNPYWPLVHVSMWCGEWSPQEESSPTVREQETHLGVPFPSSLEVLQEEEEERGSEKC